MTTSQNDLRNLKEQQQYDFTTEIDYAHRSRRGLGEDVVRSISALKNEPQWMLDFRLKALDIFLRMPMPAWGVDLGALNFEEFYYFMRATPEKARTWEDVPDAIKDTFDKLGVPEAERRFLAGVETQMDSESVYSSLKAEWERHGIIFVDMDTAVQKYPDLVQKYISTVVPIADNKFAALNSAFWSGGSFVYVPAGVNVEIPLQAYFRINAQSLGQFERTIIIAEEGSNVHYIEGCFLAGSRVATRHGLKFIETMAVGDEVLTHTGVYRKVYHTMRRPYTGKIYTIRYYGDSAQELRVTEDHPFLVVKRQRRRERNREFVPQWVTASELSVGDYLVIPVRQPASQQESSPRVTITLRPVGMLTAIERDVSFPQEPEFYRLLGYFFSEGHISNEHYLTLSFGAHETEYIQDAIALLTRYGKKAPIENEVYQNGQTLVLCSTEIARAFAYEFGSTAYDKHVPDWVLESPLPLLREFVRGMWRGDGNYSPKKKMFRYNSISRSLAYAFRDALLRLGIPASVNMQQRKPPRQPLYAVIIASPYNTKFGDIVDMSAPDGSLKGSPFHLDAQYLYVPIRSITVEEMQTEVYNFSVEEDESYVCEGVISHNCTAPQYTTAALHTGVIEIFVGKGARARYTTIQNWSTNVYNLVTQRAVVEEDGAMAWVDGNLGCLAEGSTVTTPIGLRAIEALEVGDAVLSFDEASGQLVFRKVLAKRFSGYQRVREVSYGERRLRVTDNHPFYSYIYTPERPKKLGRYQLAYVRADHLTQAIVPRRSVDFGQSYLLKIPEVETTFTSRNQHTDTFEATRNRATRLTLPERSTMDLMWLFGLFLGDGNIYRESAQNGGTRYAKVGFSIPRDNRARDKLIRCMTEIIDTPPTERKDGIQLTWNSVELADLFGLQGLEGTADTKRIPEWVFSTPESHRLAFLAGYIDADGTVSISKRRILIKSVNRQLLQDVARLAVTLGITPRIYTEFAEERQVVIMGYTTTAHGSHRIELPVDSRLLDYVCEGTKQKMLLVPNSVLKQHHHVGRSNIEVPGTVEVVDVLVGEPSSSDVPTWDIEVEGTGNFVAEGFIVHNSGITMKYPAVVLKGPRAHGEVLSIAFAGDNQHFDAGAKAIHLAPHTSSLITSKSISKGNGRADYRGLVRVAKGAVGTHSKVTCDALLLDPESRTDTYPYMDVSEDDSHIEHEATVSKISEDQLFYLMSRGLPENRAAAMIISGFLEPFVKELPMEYAVELNRLIDLQMEGSVG